MSETNSFLTVLFIADIVGKPGLDITALLLPALKKEHNVDLCIANGENGANGKGLTEAIVRQYFSVGIDVVTSGNHIWDTAASRKVLTDFERVIRPANYPRGNPGRGSVIFTCRNGDAVAILNLQGRTFMYPLDCPFKLAQSEVERLRQHTKFIIIDFHAEATAEKLAFGWFMDEKASAVIGTHTHIQTADERILPGGTAFITDIGMTGPHDSVIGLDKTVAIKRFVYQVPEKYQMAVGNNRLNGVLLKLNRTNGKTVEIKRLNLP